MSDHDAGLVRRAQRGDRAAFEELVRRTGRLAYARLVLETGDRDLAEDLTQETFLRAYRSLASLTEPAGFRPWLLTIAQNVLTDDARRNGRQKRAAPPRADTPLSLVPGPAPRPEQSADRAERRAAVLVALRSLPDDQRLALSLRYLSGADHDAIASQMGITDGALRGLLHRGLKRLRDRLPPAFADHDD